MDRGANTNSDVVFLTDEKFDFDVSLSPASSTGEDIDDEVFVGPVGHRERCVTVNIVSRVESCCVRSSWSPLSGDQLDAICEEAQKVATQLQSSEQPESENIDPNCANLQKNEFVHASEAKLNMLCGPPPTVLSPIKRQTFCVQDSPLKELPPVIQNQILKARCPKTSVGSRTNCRPAGRPQTTQHPVASRPTKSISSPVTGAKTQARMSLRGRSSIGVSVLPSRPTAPKAPQSTNRNPADRSRLQPPSKLSTSWRRSPTSSRNGSCEDLLSDSASVASDVSDCSLNSNSSLGKHALAPPTKAQGMRTRSGVKPPSDSSRRKTSSSSSSVSSFNSSFSLSPANKGKRSSSQTSLSSMPQSKPALTQKRRSVAVQPPNPPLVSAGRRLLSAQPRKPSNPTPLTHKNSNPTPLTRKNSNPTPLRRPESPAQTPVRRGSEQTGSGPFAAKTHINGPQSKPKPQALVLPTPNGALRGSSSPDASNMMKPKRLMSVKSVDSLPQKPALSALTPSGGSGAALQLKARRPSALPTPLRSRPSGIPQATPTRQIRPVRAPPTPCAAPNSFTPPESETPESAEIPLIQPFNLEEEEEPEQRPPTPAKPYQSESSSAPVVLCLSQSEARKETEPKQTIEIIGKTQPEVLLLDLPTPALRPQEKLLIDLRNTPDLMRTKTSAAELIDLSSPLIKWSPVEKKETEAPLINLSF